MPDFRVEIEPEIDEILIEYLVNVVIGYHSSVLDHRNLHFKNSSHPSLQANFTM
jgi:hypothetical protein